MRLIRRIVPTLCLIALVAAGYLTRDPWLHWVMHGKRAEGGGSTAAPPPVHDRVLLSDQAITNLGIKAVPLASTTYWQSISVPGIVVDRPGLSDRGIVSPVMGV